MSLSSQNLVSVRQQLQLTQTYCVQALQLPRASNKSNASRFLGTIVRSSQGYHVHRE